MNEVFMNFDDCLDNIVAISIYFFAFVVSPYHYIFSPNETKRPRTLSKLNDTTVWERRKTKGKVAIQKMVVDLMELYLHRLKQRRPPYPTSPSMAEFEAQFPYEPTPDQKQVVLLSLVLICFAIYLHLACS